VCGGDCGLAGAGTTGAAAVLGGGDYGAAACGAVAGTAGAGREAERAMAERKVWTPTLLTYRVVEISKPNSQQ
jgi:hypothetical protein